MTVCGKEYQLNEYLWGIDPSRPHEHGEPQTDNDDDVQDPCDCTPVSLTEEEFDRRRKQILDEYF